MRKLSVTIDIDGVMHNLSETACERLGIDIERVNHYSINLCDKLTEKEKNGLKREFADVECFRQSWVKPTAVESNELKKLCNEADVKIHSLSYKKEIMEFKRELLDEYYGYINKENITLELVLGYEVKQVEACDILIEDRYKNIIEAKNTNNACIGILIRHSYNENHSDDECIKNGILTVPNFESALVLARKLVANKKMHDC